MPGWDFAHAQGDLNLCMLRIFEGTYALDAAMYVIAIRIQVYFYWLQVLTGVVWQTDVLVQKEKKNVEAQNKSFYFKSQRIKNSTSEQQTHGLTLCMLGKTISVDNVLK